MVNGKAGPDSLNWEGAALTWLTANGRSPGFATVTEWFMLAVLTVSLPKFRDEGPRLISGAIPKPERATESGEFDALLVIKSVPDTASGEIGWRVIPSWTLCMDGTTNGNAGPLQAKAAVLRVIDWILA